MKFYYVANEVNEERIVNTIGGRRLAYYTKRYQAVNQCNELNSWWNNWRKENNSPNKNIFKVYCVESEPTEVISDNI